MHPKDTPRRRLAWAALLAILLAVPASAQPVVIDFALYNADTDQQIRNLTPTDGYDLAELPTTNLAITANVAGTAGSVRFAFLGRSNYRTENTAPFALGGDTNGDFNPVAELAQPGEYVITATPYTGPNGTGTAGSPLTLRLFVTDDGEPGPGLFNFTLVDAATGQSLRLFPGDTTIDLALVGSSLSIRVDNPEDWVRSVRFGFAGQTNYRTENVEPYALGGDNPDGSYNAVPELAQPGTYTLTATPFTGPGASGDAGTPLTSTLTVVDTGGGDPTCTGEQGDWESDAFEDGDPTAWDPITYTYTGPCVSEDGSPNPFLDYRFELALTSYDDGSVGFIVPGYYAADGNAAETGATSGNKWRAHVVLPAGSWSVKIRFYEGPNVAIADDPGPSSSQGDALFVRPSDACDDVVDCQDNRARGPLRYVGERYLRFDNGEYFLKGGADSPENLLAYADFDNTFDANSNNAVKTWQAHVQDWNAGDPTWQGGKGKGLVGALNYLASEGMNAFSFLPFNNPLGDGRDVWPWTTPGETGASRLRYDVSKMAQWDLVFQHADSLGMFLHFKTQETENDQVLDGGALGTQRKLYYRELVARFGYHLALNWNLGEENTNTDAQRRAFADHFAKLDPYDHPIVVHTFPGQYEQVYAPLLGDSELTGASIQLGSMSGGHALTLEWLQRSEAAGRPWHVALDEPGTAGKGVTCDGPGNNYADARAEALWANLMAGGTGVEWYFGYQTCAGDLTAEDWRTRDRLWDYTRHALDFFREHLPFTEMESADALLAGADGYVFAQPGEVYALYLAPGDASSASLALPAGTFDIRWFDVRNGGALQTGTVAEVSGGGTRALGAPPANAGEDWAALVTASDAGPAPGAVVAAINAGGPATTVGGVAYDADRAAQGGRTSTFPGPIAGTDDDVLYESERWGTFSYALPVPNGTYAVTLRLAEVYFSTPGRRVFDVTVEGQAAVTDLDLVAAVGARTAYDVTVTANVADGQLDLAFSADVNNAKLSALVVRGASGVAAAQVAAASTALDLKTRAFPNPSSGRVTLAYALEDAGPATVEVYDVVGRRVAVLADGPHVAGAHRATLDGSALAPGVYQWRLVSARGVESGQVTIAR